MESKVQKANKYLISKVKRALYGGWVTQIEKADESFALFKQRTFTCDITTVSQKNFTSV